MQRHDMIEAMRGLGLKGMAGALRAFDRKLQGFVSEDALLVAPETRTTSPLRWLRS